MTDANLFKESAQVLQLVLNYFCPNLRSCGHVKIRNSRGKICKKKIISQLTDTRYSTYVKLCEINKSFSRNICARQANKKLKYSNRAVPTDCLINVSGAMKRLDQGHLHPKLEVPRQTFLGRKSNPGLNDGRRASNKKAIHRACK
jgi:hypothetical protein